MIIMQIQDDELLFFLICVRSKVDSFFLTKKLGYYRLALISNYARINELVSVNQNYYKLTTQGEAFIIEANKRLHRKGIDKSIVPYVSTHSDSDWSEGIYIPKEKK